MSVHSLVKSLAPLNLVFLMILGSIGSQAMAQQGPIYPWPLEHARGRHQFSSNFGQHQWIGARYFHAGQDILAFPGQPVWSPARGRIEAGYYRYIDNEIGHYYMQKTYFPLKDSIAITGPLPHTDFQFEVALITKEGLRLEFHHVNPNNLPPDIQDAILNNGFVEAGVIIGYVQALGFIEFGVPYDHIHYNVVSDSGVHLNPLAYSPPLPDTIPPKIHTILEGPKGRCNTGIGENYQIISKDSIVSNVSELLIRVSDAMDVNQISQAPTQMRVQYQGHPTLEYDFSHSLYDQKNTPLDIRKIYKDRFCMLPGLDHPIQSQGSTISEFYFRVPIPAGYKGPLLIEFSDFAQNWTQLNMTVGGQ